MEVHSKEVQDFRRDLVSKIKSMNFDDFSGEDALFLMAIIDLCLKHLVKTSGGDED